MVVVESSQSSPIDPDQSIWVTNSGFIASSEGHVLTSLFAVTASSRVRVRTVDGRAAEAHLLALDQPSGLALLSTGLEETAPLQFSPDPPEPGQWVLSACGKRSHEGGVAVSVRPGILVSCEGCVKMGGQGWEGLLVSDLDAEPGSAGSPILDQSGRLVGIVLGVKAQGEAAACCYGLPAGVLEPILADLMQGKTRRQGWLGVAVARMGEPGGLLVRAVIDGSPSDAAGLRAGDVLVALDGALISGPRAFEEKVAAARPGGEVAFDLIRSGELKSIRVRIGERPLLIARSPVMEPPTIHLLEGPAALAVSDPLARQMIVELQRQNMELREEIERLRERLERIEKTAPASTTARPAAPPSTQPPEDPAAENAPAPAPESP